MGWFSPPGSSHHRPAYSRASSSYSSSYYRRRPRDGYIQRLLHKLKQLLRDLYVYARRHPVKLFMLVIMPLISGGALAGFAKQFGIKLPAVLAGNGGRGFSSGGGYSSGGYYGSRGYGGGSEWGGGSDFGGLGGGLGMGSLMNVAKMFM